MSKEKTENYKFKGSGLSVKEKHWAKKQFNKYKSMHHIDSMSDLNLLESLVFREAIQERYKLQVGEICKSDGVKSQNLIPKAVMAALDDNLEQIITLKDKLGLFEEKKEESPLKYIKILEKKFIKWKEKNWDSRKVTCPFCAKVFFLNIRTTNYNALKSPFFQNKVIANKPLFQKYKEGKLSKEDVAEIMGTSPDYIDWLEKQFEKENS